MSAEAKPRGGRMNLVRWVVLAGALGILLVGAGVMLLRQPLQNWQKLYNRGIHALADGDTQAAIAAFEASLRENPKEMRTYLQLVRACVLRKEFDKARESLERAVQAGMEASERDLHLAEIHLAEVRYLWAGMGTKDVLGVTETMLSEHLHPAAQLVSASAERLQRPGEGYATLGEVLTMTADCHVARAREYDRRRRLAEDTKDTQGRTEAHIQMLQEQRLAGAAREQAVAAYQRAVEKAPNLFAPRVALARLYLGRFRPEIEAARKVLEEAPADVRRRPEVMLTLAQVYLEARDFPAVLKVTESVPADRLSGEGQFAVALARAHALLEMGQLDEALKQANAAEERNPAHPFVAYLKGRILREQKRDAEAVVVLQNIVRSEAVVWPEARFLLAEALLASGSQHQALAAYRQVIKDVEASPPPSLRMAQERAEIYFKSCLHLTEALIEQQPREAATYALKAVAARPISDEAYALALRAYQTTDLREQVAEVVNVRVTGLMGLGEFDKALQVGEAALALVPKPEDTMRALARGFARAGYPQGALDYYQKILARHPQDHDTRLEVAALYGRLGRHAQAEEECQAVLAARPDDLRASILLAQSLIAQGKTAAAIERVSRLVEAKGSSPVLQEWLARLYAGTGRYEEAIRHIGQLCEKYPDSPLLRTRLAALYLAAGKRAEAKREMRAVVERWPKWSFGYLLGLLHLRDGELAEAEILYQKGREALPGQPMMEILLGLCAQAKGDISGAVAAWRAVHQRQDALVPVAQRALAGMMLANALAAQGEADKAADVELGAGAGSEEQVLHQSFLRAIACLPEAQRLEAGRHANFLLAYGLGPWREAQLEEVETLAKLVPDDPIVGSWRALIKMAAGKQAEALAELEKVAAAHPTAPAPQFILARAHVARGNYAKAKALLEGLLERAHGTRAAVLHRELGLLHEHVGRYEDAANHYREAIEASDREVLALNNLAWLLAVRLGRAAEALPYALAAVRKVPGHAAILDTLGWIHHLLGDDASAVTALERARAADPTIAEIRYHLGVVYAALQRKEEAKRELREALTFSAEFADADAAQKLLAQLESGT